MVQKFVAALLLACLSLSASASNLPNYPFIHVSGSAWRFVMPDTADLDFEIAAAGPDPAAARSVVETRLAEITALLQARGVPPADLQARDPRQDIRKGEAATAPVYEIRCGVHLVVRDMARWRDIAEALIGQPNLDAFAAAFDTTERNKIERELMQEAIRDARVRAEGMASGLGTKLGPAVAVSSSGLKNLTATMGLMANDSYNRMVDNNTRRLDRKSIVNLSVLRIAQSTDVIFRINIK